MKNFFILLFLLSMMACNKAQDDASEEYFKNIKTEVSSKFGDKSYFTGLTITKTPQGTTLSVLHTTNALHMETRCYVYAQRVWKEIYKQPLKFLPNEKPENYMFRFDEKIDAYTLSKIVKDAKKDIRDRIHVEDLKLYQLSIRPPLSGNLSSMHYYVTIKSDSLNRDFFYRYNIDGTLYDAELNNTE